MKCVHLLPTQGILMQNLAEKLQFHWLHSSLFAFEKQSKNLILRVFLTLKYPLVATFKKKLRTHFQKICIWTRQEHSRFIWETLNFLVAFLPFCFRKTVKSKILGVFFVPPRHPLVATFKEKCTRSSRKYVSESGKSIPDLAEELWIFWSLSSVFALEKQW